MAEAKDQSIQERRASQRGNLSDLTEKERVITEQLRALELERQAVAAQVVMQGLFVDVNTIIESGVNTRQDLEADYNGHPAILSIDDYFMTEAKDHTHVVVTDRSGDNLFANLYLTRKKGEDWKAKLWISKDGRDERKFGNTSGDFRDYPASGLFEGSKEWDIIQKYNEANERHGVQFNVPTDSIENGMHPDVVRVAATVRGLASPRPTTP